MNASTQVASGRRGADAPAVEPVASIVVPFRDAQRWLRPCLRSLVAQDLGGRPYEIIAVDNGSTDASASIVREFPSVRLLREPRVGAYAARNRGVEAARAPIVAFTDADCAPTHDWLARILEALDEPDVRVVVGRRMHASSSTLLALWRRYERAKQELVFSSDDARLYYGHTNNMAVERAVLDEAGPFVERLRGSDTIFVRRAVDAFGVQAVVYRPDVCITHLELTGPAALLRKLFIYGRSSASYAPLSGVRALDTGQRIHIFRAAVADDAMPIPRAAVLLGFLVAGVTAWSLGLVLGRARQRWWDAEPGAGAAIASGVGSAGSGAGADRRRSG